MLHDLPIEILSEVAAYLPYRDIVSLSQTSKQLRDATSMRLIWLNFATEYSLRHLHDPSIGSRPLRSLSTDEIRQWIERRLIIDEIWRKQSIIHPRSRTLQGFHHNLCVARIISGGRWLLTGDIHGSVFYCDLDLEYPEPTRLVGPDPNNPIPGDSQCVSLLDFIVEPGYPPSEFTIAFVGGDRDEEDPPLQWIHIWRVSVEAGDTLKATRLVSVPCCYKFLCWRLSLNADIVARPVRYEERNWIDVYWWKECTSTHVVRCAYPVELFFEYVCVIGTDRLLCVSQDNEISIFDLEPECVEYAEVRHLSFATPPRRPSWHYQLRTSRASFSRLYFDGKNYRQVMSSSQGITGIIIPASREESPIVIKLSDFTSSPPIYGLGLHKGYSGLEKNEYRFGYSWESDPEEIYGHGESEKRCSCIYPRSDYFSFDEELGRLAFVGVKKITVLDFPV